MIDPSELTICRGKRSTLYIFYPSHPYPVLSNLFPHHLFHSFAAAAAADDDFYDDGVCGEEILNIQIYVSAKKRGESFLRTKNEGNFTFTFVTMESLEIKMSEIVPQSIHSTSQFRVYHEY